MVAQNVLGWGSAGVGISSQLRHCTPWPQAGQVSIICRIGRLLSAYIVLTLCGLVLRSTHVTRPREANLILFSLFLKQFRLGASTVSWSKLFHMSMTRFEIKNNFLIMIVISVSNLGLQIFLLWPRKPLSLPSRVKGE